MRNLRNDGVEGGTPFAGLDQRQQTEVTRNHNKTLTHLAKDKAVIAL